MCFHDQFVVNPLFHSELSNMTYKLIIQPYFPTLHGRVALVQAASTCLVANPLRSAALAVRRSNGLILTMQRNNKPTIFEKFIPPIHGEIVGGFMWFLIGFPT